MTRRKILVGTREVEEHIALFRQLGLPIGAVDIRADGVTIHPPADSAAEGNAFDRWLQKDTSGDGSARRQ